MKVFVAIAVCLLGVVTYTNAQGRAFPVDSENFVEELFGLKWDPTNFLVDLSGKYAGCDRVERGQIGPFDVDRRTKDNEEIRGIHDIGRSTGSDVISVNDDIINVVKRWTGRYRNIIRGADAFGCSVRPKCNGQVSVVCLFNAVITPGIASARPPTPPSYRPTLGRAFTPEQYDVAEAILGNGMEWDKSHFLENRVGRATKCNMMQSRRGDIEDLEADLTDLGYNVVTRYGMAKNTGETEPAMKQVLRSFKRVGPAKKVGCAVIPDCTIAVNMYVLVTCVFQM